MGETLRIFTRKSAKIHESPRKFAQIRPVNPRLFGFLRVRLIFFGRPNYGWTEAARTEAALPLSSLLVAGTVTKRSRMFAYVRLKSPMFAYLEKKYFFRRCGRQARVRNGWGLANGLGTSSEDFATGRRPEASGIILAGWTGVGHVSWRQWKLD
jgi:hypothetical protein